MEHIPELVCAIKYLNTVHSAQQGKEWGLKGALQDIFAQGPSSRLIRPWFMDAAIYETSEFVSTQQHF